MMENNRLFAGAGRADIEFPAELFPLEGFRGVHDCPAARVLLLHCGERAALVCLELVMLPLEEVEAIQGIVSRETGTPPQAVWVHTTHAITTPHAPHAPVGVGGVALEIDGAERSQLARKSELYRAAVESAVTQAARAAAGELRPARLGVGKGTCRVNVNRDVSTVHGWWTGFAPDGPSNHTATVLRLEDEGGVFLAGFISYGLKPCAIDNAGMESGDRVVSGDVPALACRLLEEQLGAPCLFAMSAAGDQVPLEQARYDVVEQDGSVRTVDLGVEKGLELAERLGRQMARELAPVFQGISCTQRTPAIRLGQGYIDWPGKARGKMEPTLRGDYRPEGSQRVEILALTLGDTALVGLKPELNTPTEAQLQAASPYSRTLVVSMVNGGQKYMPDRRSYENCTWEAQSAPMMPGAAEAWVERAAALLEDMRKEGC